MITTVDDLNECAKLWQPQRAWRIFHDWDFRCRLAAFDDVRPYFILHRESGTVLPAGLLGDTVVFFGGRYFAERNGFIGGPDGRREIFAYLRDAKAKLRLISWAEDPMPFLPQGCERWDVPYNQYWEVNSDVDFTTFLERVKPGTAKEFAYLERKFRPQVVDDNLLEVMDYFIEDTVTSFAQRGARCTYAEPGFRERALLVASIFRDRGMLRGILARYKGQDIGLVVFTEDRAAKEAVFLFNLYKHSPSKVSNLLTMAIVKHSLDNGLRLDGMRGSFALKPRAGYRPGPSYAVVNIENWTLKPQTDLTPDDLFELYGRRFGAETVRERQLDPAG